MILVAGATGSLGGRIVRDLVESGDKVRVLVRAGSDYSHLAQLGVDICLGDLRDPESLVPACNGVRAIISTASATNRSDDTPENVDGRGNQNLIEAARHAGVSQFILISTNGASLESPVPAFRAKAAAENSLRSSGIAFTILQSNAFMDVWFGMLIEAPVSAGQPVTLVGESRRRHSFVAERDVAAFAASATRVSEARNRTLEIGGPAAVTLREVVQAYEQAIGRSIKVRSVAPGDPIPGLPEPVWAMAAALESFDSPMPMAELARAFNVPQTSVQQFAAESRLVAASTSI